LKIVFSSDPLEGLAPYKGTTHYNKIIFICKEKTKWKALKFVTGSTKIIVDYFITFGICLNSSVPLTRNISNNIDSVYNSRKM
jgi:hypothetical protein